MGWGSPTRACPVCSVEQTRLDRTFILRAQRRGQQVYPWTANTAADMERLVDLGIDGYLSRPKPERAIRRVRSWLAD